MLRARSLAGDTRRGRSRAARGRRSIARRRDYSSGSNGPARGVGGGGWRCTTIVLYYSTTRLLTLLLYYSTTLFCLSFFLDLLDLLSYSQNSDSLTFVLSYSLTRVLDYSTILLIYYSVGWNRPRVFPPGRFAPGAVPIPRRLVWRLGCR